MDENVADVVIASLSAKDKDKEQKHTFSIKTQQDEWFSIDGANLKVHKFTISIFQYFSIQLAIQNKLVTHTVQQCKCAGLTNIIILYRE